MALAAGPDYAVAMIEAILPDAARWIESALRLAGGGSPATLMAGAALAMAIETFFPPFPCEGVVIALAFAAARQGVSPLWLVTGGALGSFISLYALYQIGRGPLRGRFRRWIERSPGALDGRFESIFRRWGYLVILVSRFLTGIRGPLTLLAGVYGLTPGRTALALFPACVVWNVIVVSIGYSAGRGWDGTPAGLAWVGLGLTVALAAAWIVGLGIRSGLSRERRGRAAPPTH